MNTAYQSLCARLMMAGVPDARFDAVQLHKFVTGRDPRLDNGPTADEASSLRVLGERRAARGVAARRAHPRRRLHGAGLRRSGEGLM